MRIKIETYGCSANVSDSEYIADILSKHHEIVDEEPDLYIINTCGVKGPTEDKIINRLEKIKNKKVLVCGCLPLINLQRLRKKFPDFSYISPHSIGKINQAVEKISQGLIFIDLSKQNKKPLFKDYSFSPVIGIVPISEGCLGNCTYCATKLARGDLLSFPEKSIKRQVEHFIMSGKREIWITSQDTGAYGKDIGTDLLSLMNQITEVKGDFWVRIGMMNPNHWQDKFIEIFKNRKVFKFVHIPVQSGSNKVLREMNRFYTIKDFKRIISRLRQEIPGVTISTDIICGYPTENEGDWEKTKNLIRWLEPDVLNISKFYPRPNTQARNLEYNNRVPLKRSRQLSKLFYSIMKQNNEKWLGWEGEILVDEEGKGRNIFYKQVLVDGKIGERKKVKIVDFTPTSLIGEVIK